MKKLLVLLATLAACGQPPAPKTGPAIVINNGATNNGATNNGATNNGATNNGATNNGATNNGPGTNNEWTNNGVVNNETAAPRILTFDANVSRLSEGESISFTAVVTEPDGIDDLIGGTLNDAATGRPYGSFSTAAAEGSYSLSLGWNALHAVEPSLTSRRAMSSHSERDVLGRVIMGL